MKRKIDYRSGEECLHVTYEDMEDMTLDDAIFILSEFVRKYHESNNDRERINLPRARIIKSYQMCRKTPSFSYGDIRHVHRIYASN